MENYIHRFYFIICRGGRVGLRDSINISNNAHSILHFYTMFALCTVHLTTLMHITHCIRDELYSIYKELLQNTSTKFNRFLFHSINWEPKLIGITGARGVGKTSKVYTNNTNLITALLLNNYNLGNVRETFFVNQTSQNANVNLHDEGDFIIDEKHIFEIGGKNKTKKQIRDLENAFIVKDDIEFGYGNVIPLWHFGMLY